MAAVVVRGEECSRMNYIDQKIADQLDEILDNQRTGCKWCQWTGWVMKTITPGLEKPVPCECRGVEE
jgi:hypothetical protein